MNKEHSAVSFRSTKSCSFAHVRTILYLLFGHWAKGAVFYARGQRQKSEQKHRQRIPYVSTTDRWYRLYNCNSIIIETKWKVRYESDVRVKANLLFFLEKIMNLRQSIKATNCYYSAQLFSQESSKSAKLVLKWVLLQLLLTAENLES